MKKVILAVIMAILGVALISNRLFCQTYITEYTEYTTVYYFTEDLIITEGNELVVINDGVSTFGEIQFGEDAKLIVERKAKLTVDGGILTNLDNNMWRGVEVWGDASQPQFDVYQGMVDIKNGGVIEYAMIGIRTIKAVDILGGGEQLVKEYAGGIVSAANSKFVNNNVAVQFYPHPFNSVSKFYYCTFETNSQLLVGQTHPDYFIRIRRMSGVRIIACDFNNTTDIPYFGNGIHAADATFTVDGHEVFHGHWDRCTFRQLYYGIHVVNTSTVYYPDIRHSDFYTNARSVYISFADGARVTSCSFFSELGGENYELYLNNSFKYHIEDNFFSGPEPEEGAQPLVNGIYINNSGSLWNQIYNNRFEFLQYGTIAYGLNRNPFTNRGLCIRCNDYENNVYDIVVNGLGNSHHGIARDQGYLGANDTLPAGNTFSSASPWLIWNYKNSDGMAFINYVYHGINFTPLQIDPILYYSPVTMHKGSSTETIFHKETACPSKLDTWPDTESERLALNNADVQIDQNKDQLEALVDAGDTYMMNFNVLTSTPPEASSLYSELIGESPFLSDTVLKSAIYKENVLPNSMIRDILVANSQSAKSQGIMDALDERFTLMPEWMKEQILAGVNHTSAKENLETDIRYWDKKRSEHFENMYQYYRKDTLNPQASADSLVLLLAQDNRPESKYRLAFLNMKNGAWSTTQQLLSSIPNQFELTSLEAAVHQDYVALFSVLNQLNGELPSEGSQEATDLELLAEKDEHYPGACARNLLIVAGLLDYEEPVVLPEEELKSAEIFNHDLFNDPGKPEALTIFPNPAGNYFIINYNAEDYTGEISIKVSDMNGKLLVTKQYTLRRNQEVIHVADWKAGIYNISLMINGKIINTKKITVAH